MKVVTKTFFSLNGIDQRQVVDAIIHDLEVTIGRHVEPDGDRKAKQQVRRIRKKAVEAGVY
jgi:hypothetical protein